MGGAGKGVQRMRRRLVIFVVATTVAGSLAAGALASSGPSKRFVIGVQVNLTGPNTVAGTFSVAGAFSDSGSDTATFALTPTNENSLIVTGHATLTGANGTISFEFRFASSPASAPREYGSGQAVVTAATGSYAGLVGKKLRLEEESDLGTGTVTQLLQGNAG